MSQMLTTEAGILDPAVTGYLAGRAAEYQRLLRRLHVEVNGRGKSADAVVKHLLRTEGWTARQLNALKIQLEGMTSAWKEGLARRVKELITRSQKLERVIADEDDPNARHHRKRKLARWKDRLGRWEKELQAGKPNFCFGGRKLFRAQFNLRENGHNNHEEWLADWREARSDSFMLGGKAADANGCADCRIQVLHVADGELRAVLKLRKLNREISGAKAGPKDFIHIPVTFRYNIPQILAAIKARHPMSYRCFRREGKWRVHLITKTVEVAPVSDANNGSLGIDCGRRREHAAGAAV